MNTLKESIKSPSSVPVAPNAVANPPQGGGAADRLLGAHQEAKRGRGRPPGSKNAAAPQAPAVAMAALPQLFNEENSKHVLQSVFAVPAIVTGSDVWFLDEREQKALAPAASNVLNDWSPADRKWSSLLVFSLSLSGIVLLKAKEYNAQIRARNILKAAEQKAKQDEVNKARPQENNNADTRRAEKGFLAGPTPEPPTLPN